MRNIQGTLFGKTLSVFLCWNILLTSLPFQFLNVVRADYPSEPTTTITTDFEYDGNGNLISRVDGNGNATTFTYDAMNRLSSIDYPDGDSPDVTFTYDVHGNSTSITDWTGTTEYTYDIFDRLTSVSDPKGNFILYDYDEVGNITDLFYGNWLMVWLYDVYTYIQYDYEANNRISFVTNVFTGDVTSYQYDKAGNVTCRELPNGVYTLYGYDSDGRLTGVEHQDDSNDLIVKYEYTLNAIGNRTQVVETTPSGPNTTTYTYDALDRLDTVTYPDSRFVDYDYDTFGNRIRMTETIEPNTTVTEYYYDSDSRLLYTEVDGIEDEHFFYDAVGNLIQRVGVSPGNTRQIEYIYDCENRLIRYYDSTNNVEYVYNGVGQRVAKIVNGQRTNFLNDANRYYVQALMEMDEDGFPTVVREWGNELINCEDLLGGDRHYYLHDAINGSVRRVIDSSVSVVNTYEYDAFGKPTTKVEGVANDYQFHGEVQEEETGLVFLRARNHDPVIGRFLTRDPARGELEEPSSFQPYSVCGNDPVNRGDPAGTDSSDWQMLWETAFKGLTEIVKESPRYISSHAWDLGKPFVEQYYPAAVRMSSFAKGAGYVSQVLSIYSTGDTYFRTAQSFIAGKASQADLCHDAAMFATSLIPGPLGYIFKATDYGSTKLANWIYGNNNVGGVALNRTAEVLLDINKIKGGTYDPATGQLILYGEEDVTLPAMDIDDLAVAARAASLGGAPIVSIDPPEVACADNGCNEGQCYSVRYGDPVWDDVVGDYVMLDLSSKTHFGWVMFEADRVMKTLALGKDNITCAPVTSGVPGYKSMAQRWRESGSSGNSSARFWFQPKDIELVPSPDGKSMVFSDASIELLTESKYLSNGQVFGDPEAEAFAQHFTDHYDEFAVEFPIFEELRQLAKIVGIMRWIKENNVPMDLSLIEQHQPAYYDAAPWITPKTSVTETWRDYVPGGWIDYTLTVEGGVTYCKDLQFQGASSGPEDAILTARPSETDLSWTANVNGTVYNAAAISLNKKPKDGGLSWSDNDVTVHVNGSLPLTLTRYFDSFDIVPSMFGWGWEATPHQLKFKDDRSKFNLCSLQWEGYGEVWYIDRPSQAVYKYVPSGMYDKVADSLGIASRFDPNEDILVYRYETKEVPGLLFSDNKTNITMRLANGTLLNFNTSGYLIHTEDRNGNQILYSYDPNDRLESITEPVCSKTISFVYDVNDRVVSVFAPGNRTIAYTYDSAGNLISSHTNAPDGRKVQYVYDNYHNLLEVQNANGQAIATRQFDVYGRVSSVVQPGVTTPFLQDYSLVDRTTNLTGPEGISQSMQFDENYNLLQLTDPRGNITGRTYNSYQDIITETNAEGRTTKFYYNYPGDRIATTLPNGRSDVTIVNVNGDPLLSFYVSPDTHFEDNFDNEHFQISVPNEGIYSVDFTEYEYDPAGNLVKIIDARGNEQNFSYDSHGNCIWLQNGCSYQTDYSYDSCARLTDVSNEEGHHIHYEYDEHDNMIQTVTTAGTVDMTYDSMDRLETLTNGDVGNRHITIYSYNDDDQIIGVIEPNGAITYYSYDQRRNLSNITHADIVRFEYVYDELNRLTQIRYFGTAADAHAAVIPVFPVGVEQLQGDVLIQWHAVGNWTDNENLEIYYSTNGTDWILIDTVNYADDSYVWTSGLLVSETVRLKFVRPGDLNFRVPVTDLFQVLNGGRYYVNDTSTVGDEYCNAAGCSYPSCTGLTPDDPVDDIQDVIDNYPLQPGDIMRL